MSKYIIRLLGIILFVMALNINVSAQTISLKTVTHRSEIETPGEIIFSDAIIEFKKSSIKCKKLIIKGSVQKFKLKGSVKITCDDIEMESVVGSVRAGIETEGKGSITIEYKGSYTENNRNLLIKDAKKVKFYITKI